MIYTCLLEKKRQKGQRLLSVLWPRQTSSLSLSGLHYRRRTGVAPAVISYTSADDKRDACGETNNESPKLKMILFSSTSEKCRVLSATASASPPPKTKQQSLLRLAAADVIYNRL